MNKEEKKAIERFKANANYCITSKETTQTILNLIEKQSKEIERLEARKYMLNAETGEISQIPIDNNYISKDKIKAKIEYLLKRYDTEEDFCSYDVLISILKSLLEKE